MAAGVIPASLPSLKAHDCSLSFAKSVDFAKVLCAPRPQRIKSPMIRSPLIRNSTNPGSDTAELEPASKGSPLLGITHGPKYALTFACTSYLIIHAVHDLSWKHPFVLFLPFFFSKKKAKILFCCFPNC